MRRFILKLRKRAHLERDLDEELRFHKENSGRPFGNMTRIREDARELWTFPFIEGMLRDLLHACRVLAKSRSFSLVCILTLALGIGLNTAVFTLYDALTYRLLPVKCPERLVRVVRKSGATLHTARFSYKGFAKVRLRLEPVANVVGASSLETIYGSLPQGGGSEGMKVRLVAGDYFGVLGIAINPGHVRRDDELARTAVLSHSFWVRRLHADPGVTGAVMYLGGKSFTVAGVAPDGFYGTGFPPRMPDVWLPALEPSAAVTHAEWQNGDGEVIQILARRKPGVSVDQISSILGPLGGEVADGDRQSRLAAIPATAFQTNMSEFRGTGTVTVILMGTMATILLIGCVNLVNLTMSRNAARRREIGVRLAIGASRCHIVRQLTAETLLLAVVGGAIGFGLSAVLCNWIRIAAVSALDQISAEALGGFELNVAPDWRVAAYTLAVSILVGTLVGLWPAWGSAVRDLNLKIGGLRRRQRNLLISGQIAACFILLAGAGSLCRGTYKSRSADPGFATEKILLANADLSTLDESARARTATLRDLLARVTSLPYVQSVALADRAPFLGTGADQFENEEHEQLKGRFNSVSGSYFATLGIPILAGRAFSQEEADRGSAEVVVSETAARYFWPHSNPLGKQICSSSAPSNGLSHSIYTVVGVAKVVRNTFLSKNDNNYFYFPKPVSEAGGWILLRTQYSPESVAPSVREALIQASPALAAHSHVISLEKGPIQIQKLMTDVPGAVALFLGLAALMLASIGVYGAVMYLVSQRIRTIGIHVALGAQRFEVIWLVLREGLGCVVRGSLIGLSGATCLWAALAVAVKTPDLPDLTYQAGVFDPATFLITTAVLGLAVAAACFMPVYRATRVDPVIALRCG